MGPQSIAYLEKFKRNLDKLPDDERNDVNLSKKALKAYMKLLSFTHRRVTSL